jgi:Spy/CpxP family protein refolding chaperone
MKIRRTTLVLAAFVALLALPFAAEAQRPGRDPGELLHNPRALARYLKLTPEQVTATQKLLADLKAVVEPLRQAEKTLRETLRTDLNAASPNPCTVGQDLLAVRANEEKIKAALDEFDRKFSALLTPEQLARYEALKEAARLLHGGGND